MKEQEQHLTDKTINQKNTDIVALLSNHCNSVPVPWPIAWVGRGTWETIQQRSFSSLFCRRPSWAVLAWQGCPLFDVVHPALPLPTTVNYSVVSFLLSNRSKKTLLRCVKWEIYLSSSYTIYNVVSITVKINNIRRKRLQHGLCLTVFWPKNFPD